MNVIHVGSTLGDQIHEIHVGLADKIHVGLTNEIHSDNIREIHSGQIHSGDSSKIYMGRRTAVVYSTPGTGGFCSRVAYKRS